MNIDLRHRGRWESHPELPVASATLVTSGWGSATRIGYGIETYDRRFPGSKPRGQPSTWPCVVVRTARQPCEGGMATKISCLKAKLLPPPFLANSFATGHSTPKAQKSVKSGVSNRMPLNVPCWFWFPPRTIYENWVLIPKEATTRDRQILKAPGLPAAAFLTAFNS